MAGLQQFLDDGWPVASQRPWPRAVVDRRGWAFATERLADGGWTLLDMWGEPGAVHLALLDDACVGVASYACTAGGFPSIAARHPPAARLERAIADLYGSTPEGATDTRPWLDHGRWGLRAPLGDATASPSSGTAYAFLPTEGDSLHRIPVGPVHAGIIEPGHFRFTANGDTVVRLEQRLGYVHKGVEGLLAGAEIGRAAMLAGRVSGDSTVAYALAFARAVEAATGTEVPPRAHVLRALMAELERIANHLGDIGAICNDAAFALMLAHCGVLREQVLRAAAACFGHRLMRDVIRPGGVARDLADDGVPLLRDLAATVERRFEELVELYDNTASLQERVVATGRLSPELAQLYGAGGYVGRASGRGFDARRALPYPPYDRLAFDVPIRDAGDVSARVWVRIEEVRQSLRLVRQSLAALPPGPVAVPVDGHAGEGIGLVEGFRGDILAWVRLGGDGRVERGRLRDPSWFQWPLLEAAIEGSIVADFPLCNKSFNCSYSGHDL